MRTSNVTRMSQNFNSKGQIEGHDVLGDELIEEEETLMRGAKVRKPLLIAAPVVVLIVALFVYLHGGRYETTDNAYLQSGLISVRSEEHTSELQSLMRISYAVFCLKKKTHKSKIQD